MRKSAYLLVGIALGASTPAHAEAAEDWIGRYEPISAVCKGMTLVVVPRKLSLGNCSRVAFTPLEGGSGLAARIDDSARCPLAGKVLTLAPDGPSANTLEIYENEAAWRAGRPNLVCAYSR